MDLLTVKQAAEPLRISVGAVYALCASAKLAHYRMGTHQSAIRIDRSDLFAYLQKCKYEPPKREPDEPRSYPARRSTPVRATKLKHLRVDTIALPGAPHA